LLLWAPRTTWKHIGDPHKSAIFLFIYFNPTSFSSLAFGAKEAPNEAS